MITDADHQATAAQMRRALAAERHSDQHRQSHVPDSAATVRRHADGHVVALRPLPDYDALFGVDFTADPTPDPTPDFTPDIAVTSEEASS